MIRMKRTVTVPTGMRTADVFPKGTVWAVWSTDRSMVRVKGPTGIRYLLMKDVDPIPEGEARALDGNR